MNRWNVARASLAIACAILAEGAIGTAESAIVTRTVTYTAQGTTLEGYLAFDDAADQPRPGVLIIHQWMGLTDYEKMRCQMLAEAGYVAFAADIYGQGIRPANTEAAAAESGKYFQDTALFRQRLTAALDWLAGARGEENQDPGAKADPNRIAVIGYCFGGTGALQLARTGANLSGAVSFHGVLNTPEPSDAKNIACPLLVLHGLDDPYVPLEQVHRFVHEMSDADVDLQFVAYTGAVHAFTQKGAGDDPSKGAAYHAKADARSWNAMMSFFDEIFRP
jgi:dienelactone hydrolase